MSVRISVWKILTIILTVAQFCVSGLHKEDLVNVTRIGKCLDKCQNECQDECRGNTDCQAVLCARIDESRRNTDHDADSHTISVSG